MKKGDKTVKVTRVPNRVPTVQGKESVASNFHFKTFKQIDREEIEKRNQKNIYKMKLALLIRRAFLCYNIYVNYSRLTPYEC